MGKNLDNAMESIGKLVFAKYGANVPTEIQQLLDTMPTTYVFVDWPQSQEYMDEDWFNDEAILSEDSAYLIPLNRLM